MPSRFILVVDPSPVSWQRTGRALEGTACYAMAARTAAEATAAVTAGDVALVVASMRLPDLDGYELTRRVRAIRPGALVMLLADAAEPYDAVRGEEVGVTGVIEWPCAVDRLRRYFEAALAPLPLESEVEDLPSGAMGEAGEPVDGLTIEDLPAADIAPLAAASAPVEPVPAIADERMASFLPRDWKRFPPVRVDPSFVTPALERAILEHLPEVVDTVLRRALATSPALRDLIEVAVDEAVRAQLGPIARSVIEERLAEIEAASEDGS
jgi:CheY-like chemotaxis protein